MQAFRNTGRFVAASIALVVTFVSCHGTLPEEGFVGPGATLADLAAIIKEIRARTTSSDTIPPIIADIREGTFENLEEFAGVDDVVVADPANPGPNIQASGPVETVSGGTVQVNLQSSSGDEVDKFDFVLITIGEIGEEAGGGSSTAALTDGPERETAYFVIQFESLQSNVDLFITTQELPDGENPNSDYFQGFQCIYQAGQLSDGVLKIGAADEDSQNPVDVQEVCYGQLQITATWNSSSDLDLVVNDAGGATVTANGPPANGVITTTSTATGGGTCQTESLLFESFCWGAELPGLLGADPLFGEYTAKLVNTDHCEDTEFTLSVLVAGPDGAAKVFKVFAGTLGAADVESDVFEFQFPAEADLAVVKSLIASDEVVDGSADELDPVLFNLTVSNEADSPNKATGVQVTDVLPEGLTYTGHSVDAGGGDVVQSPNDPQRIVWTVGELPTGESFTLILDTQVEFGQAGATIENTATVVADQTSVEVNATDDGDADSASVSIVDNQYVDLQITKTVDDEDPDELALVTYTLTVTSDAQGGTATGVRVLDSLPEGLTFSSAGASQGDYDEDLGVWTVGELAPGAQAFLDLVAEVDFGTAGAQIQNLAAVSGDQEEPEVFADDNADFADITVADNDFVDLAVSAEIDNATPDELDTVVLSFTAINSALGADATGVAVDIDLPAGLTFEGAKGPFDPGTGTWSIGDMTPGGVAALDILATVDFGTAGNSVLVTASASADQTDPLPDNDTDSVGATIVDNGFVDLSVACVADDATPDELQDVSFTLTAACSALGGPATEVEVSTGFSPGLSFVSAVGPGSFNDESGTWSVGSLAPGASAQLVVTAQVEFGTANDVLNLATAIDALQEDPLDADNDTNTAVTVVDNGFVDLSASVTPSDTEPDELQSLTIGLGVTNSALGGPATGVSVAAPLPAGVTLAGAEGSQGSYDAGVWTVGNLAAGASASFTLEVSVEFGTANDTLALSAAASANETDPLPANDDAAASMTVNDNGFVDLALVVDTSDANPDELQAVDFTFEVTNSALGGPATGVFVDSELPDGVTFQSTSVSQGSLEKGAWLVGALAPGASAQLTITALVDFGTANDVLSTDGSTAANEADPLLDNNADSADLTVADNDFVDLAVTTTPSTTAPDELQTVTYTVVASNSGLGTTASGVAVDNTVQGDLALESTDTSQGSYDPASGLWSVGTLEPGQSEVLTIVATVNFGAAGENLTTSASIAANQTDPLPANNAANSVAVVADNGFVDLAVSNGVSNGNPAELEQLDIFVTVTNSALGGPATGVFVGGILPDSESADFISASSESFEPGKGWFVGDLAPGASANLTVTVQAGLFAGGTTVPSAAEAFADQVDPLQDNNLAITTFSVQDTADLALSKSVDPAEALPGDTITWTLRVDHLGGAATQVTTVSDLLPAGLFLFGTSASQGFYDGKTGEWNVGTLIPGGFATLTMTTSASSQLVGQTLTNTASVSADRPDPNTGNNTASASVFIQSFPVLSISMSVDPETVFETESATYTVTAAHVSGGTATNTFAFLSLPPGFAVSSSSASQGTFSQSTWSIGDIGPGTTTVLTVTGSMGLGTGGSEYESFVDLSWDQNSGGPFDSALLNVLVLPDLAVGKFLDDKAGAFSSGDFVPYVIQAFLTKEAPVTGVVVEDLLPPGLSFASARATQGSFDSESGVWTVGTLATTDDVAALFLEVTVDDDTGPGTIVNTATATGDQPDANTANNTSSASIQIVESITADFLASPLSGVAPLTVDFTDTSTGPVDQWLWDFGDEPGPTFGQSDATPFEVRGTTSAVTFSSEQNPTFTYTQPGTYTVSLTASGSGLSDTLTQVALIDVAAPPDPIANFSVDPSIGFDSLQVQFTDLSSDAQVYLWDFDEGAGFESGLGANPAHTYLEPGFYTPQLFVSNASGTDTFALPSPIIVGESQPSPPLLGSLSANVVCSPPTSLCNCIGFNGNWYELDLDYTDFNGDVFSNPNNVSVLWRTNSQLPFSVISGSAALANISGDGFQGSISIDPCWAGTQFSVIEVRVGVLDGSENYAETPSVFLADHIEIGLEDADLGFEESSE